MGRHLPYGRRAGRRDSTALGIRTAGARVEQLESLDETAYGSFWFDLRTRSPLGAAVKRQIDIFGSLALIVALSPLFLLIALLIKLTSSGPVFFIQRRIGFRCNEFGMYKFRSMVVDAERMEHELRAGSQRAFFKHGDDPRVTSLGRFLRRYSLDELPQLFNVLEGEMSLVGPRPLLVSDLEKFPMRGQMRRFSVRPGLTGLWQISGRSATTDADRMRLDREYVNNWSLWLDLEILLKTPRAVVSGDGAV